MNAPAKLGAFAVALTVVFGGALAVGNAAGPIGYATDDPRGITHDGDVAGAPAVGPEDGGHGSAAGASDKAYGGLEVSQDGYTLALQSTELPAGEATPVSFQVLGPDDQPLKDFAVSHEKELHLIVVRRDSSGFQHVHPTRDAAGTWTAPLALTGGQWRVFADFTPTADEPAITLGADVAVAGEYDPQPLPAVSRTAEVDGYSVTLAGDLAAGQESELTLSVSRDGRSVTDLQPYLAAYGHLVALRQGDLAYLHVHPAGEPGDGETEPGPDITFYATAPTAGDYRLFLDFQHDGVVRTAEFTVRATATQAPAGEPAQPAQAPTDDGAGHGADGH